MSKSKLAGPKQRSTRDSRERALTERGTLRESVPSGPNPLVPIRIIVSGLGNDDDNLYYPIDTLSRDYWMFEGKKMFVDHQTADEDITRPEGSLYNWVATVQDVSWNHEASAIDGFADVHSEWFGDLIQRAGDRIGISINAWGGVREGDIQGQTVNIVDEFLAINSVDFVTEAGAGGRIRDLYESLSRKEDNMDPQEKKAQDLKEARNKLHALVENGTAVVEVPADNSADITELKESNVAMAAEIKTLHEDNTKLATRVVDLSTSLIVSDVAKTVDRQVKESDLPEFAKDRVRLLMAGRCFVTSEGAIDTEKLTEAVTAAVTTEKEYLALATESGHISHSSGSGNDGNEVQLKETRHAMWRQLGYTDETIEKLESVRS